LLAPLKAMPAAKGDVSGAPRRHLLERAALAAGLTFRSHENKETFDSRGRCRRCRLRDSGGFSFDALSLLCREFGDGWHQVALFGVVGAGWFAGASHGLHSFIGGLPPCRRGLRYMDDCLW